MNVYHHYVFTHCTYFTWCYTPYLVCLSPVYTGGRIAGQTDVVRGQNGERNVRHNKIDPTVQCAQQLV